MSFSFKNTGYKPPVIKDKRNFPLEKAQPVKPFPTSSKTDLSAIPVFMQYQLPDCVENAITFIKKYHTWKATGVVPDLSRRFLAIRTVQKDGFPFSEGTNLQTALNVAHNDGICETPYLNDNHELDEATFIGASLPQPAIDNAQTHKIASYAFVTDLSANGLKNAIYQNGVVAAGIKIDQNWWTDIKGAVTWAMNAVLPIRPPTSNSSSISGHAIVYYAYDEQYFYFMNSWSTEWGDNGHGWHGVNDLPELYEAATIVDLTDAQIAALKVTETDQNQVANQLQNTTDPLQKTFLQKLVDLLQSFINRYLSQ